MITGTATDAEPEEPAARAGVPAPAGPTGETAPEPTGNPVAAGGPEPTGSAELSGPPELPGSPEPAGSAGPVTARAMDEATLPETVDEATMPETVGGATPPETADEAATPETGGGAMMPRTVSGATMPETVGGATSGEAPPPGGAPVAARARLRERVDGLFPDPRPGRRITKRRVLLALVVVAAGAVVSLLRTGGTGPLQSMWQEDAKDVMQDALNMSGLAAIVRPLNGYFVIGPRLIGEVAAQFPVARIAAVMSVSAALLTAALALQVYAASRAHFSNRLVRFAVAAPMLVSPVAENYLSEIYNRPVCLHFFAAYALFWLLLWTPATRAGRVGALLTVGLFAASTIIAIAFIPLAALRLAFRRTAHGAWMLGFLVGCAVVNLGAPYVGIPMGPRAASYRFDPVWAVANFVVWAVPQSVLGFRLSGTLPGYGQAAPSVGQVATIVATWIVVGAVIAAAVVGARRGILRPLWTLSALAAGYALLLFAFLVMANGAITQRYLYPVAMLVLASLVCLLAPAGRTPGPGLHRPRGRSAARRRALAPLAVLGVLFLVVAAVNFRFGNTYRSHAPRWADQVARAAFLCRHDVNLGFANVRGAPQPFASVVSIPCHLLRNPKSITCYPPDCQWVDPPVVTKPK